MIKDIHTELQDIQILSSAPCRVDIGGTWDLKCFALPFAHIHPVTTNIALSMRTHIRLSAYKAGRIRIWDNQHEEEYPADDLDLSGHFGFLFSVSAHFALSGIDIEIGYESPPRSGLGGSGVLAVALAGALAKAREPVGSDALTPEAIVELVYNIEDGLRYSYTGLQDQCAAAFGGIHRWHWTYGEMDSKFRREELLSTEGYTRTSDHLLVAYIGENHDSNDVNSKQVTDFLSGTNRSQWFRINEIANEFAHALQQEDWKAAGERINEETDIRCSIVPSRITPVGESLQAICHEMGVGFATAGGGNGGCVWALAQNPDQIADLSSGWEAILKPIPTATLLPVTVEPQGLLVEKITIEADAKRP